MKYLYLLLLLLFLTMETPSQTSPDSSGLSVLQKKWSKSSQSSPSASRASTSREDPFRAINETRQALEDRKADVRDNAIRREQGLPPEQPRSSTVVREVPNRNISSSSYIYQIKVQNTGTKTIQTVAWEYVFFNPTTKREIGKLKFISKTNLKAGKTDNLVMSSPNPPTVIIQAKDEGRYVEQINIKSIEYTDGTGWKADSK
jgi:hypothetical protein